MPKKPKGVGDKKKVGGVKTPADTKSVEETKGVSGVGEVKKTSSVGGVKGSGAVRGRQATQKLSIKDREKIFQLIEEEAEKLFSSKDTPGKKKEIVEQAVKMAIDSGLVDEEEA